eukprot:5515474-Prymnesium_polylepis.1
MHAALRLAEEERERESASAAERAWDAAEKRARDAAQREKDGVAELLAARQTDIDAACAGPPPELLGLDAVVVIHGLTSRFEWNGQRAVVTCAAPTETPAGRRYSVHLLDGAGNKRAPQAKRASDTQGDGVAVSGAIKPGNLWPVVTSTRDLPLLPKKGDGELFQYYTTRQVNMVCADAGDELLVLETLPLGFGEENLWL